MLAHADDVGGHHPAGSVDVGGRERLGELVRAVTALQRMASEDHQPLNVVSPAPVANTGHCVMQALRSDGVGMEIGPPVREMPAHREFVLVGVAGAEMPIQMSHVLAPAEDLPDESLHGGQRCLLVAVGLFGGFDVRGYSTPTLRGTDSSECDIAQSSPMMASS